MISQKAGYPALILSLLLVAPAAFAAAQKRAVADACAQALAAPAPFYFEGTTGQYSLNPDYALNILSTDLAQGLKAGLGDGFLKPTQDELNEVTLALMGLYTFDGTQAIHYYRDLQSSIRRDHAALDAFVKKWEAKASSLTAADKARLKSEYKSLVKAYPTGVRLDLAALQRDVDQVVSSAVAKASSSSFNTKEIAGRLAQEQAFLNQTDAGLREYAKRGLCVTTAALNTELLLLAGSAPWIFERVRYEKVAAFSKLIERVMQRESRYGDMAVDPRYGTETSRVAEPLLEEIAALGINPNLAMYESRRGSAFGMNAGEVGILGVRGASATAPGHAIMAVAYDPATKVLTYMEPNTPNVLRTAVVNGDEVQDQYLRQILRAGDQKVSLVQSLFFKIYTDADAMAAAQRMKIRDFIQRDIDLRTAGSRTTGRILSVDTKAHTVEFAPAGHDPVQIPLLIITGIDLR